MGKEIDTTVAIWEDLYLARLPELNYRSVEDINRYGTRITGDPLFDAGMHNSFITVYINIDKMVEYFKEGVEVRIVNNEDTKRIYEAISNHLHAWVDQLRRGVNIGGAPIEDLEVMDSFAECVFGHAVMFYDEQNNVTDLSRYLDQFTSANPLQSVVKRDNVTGKIFNSDTFKPKRDGITDFLIQNWR